MQLMSKMAPLLGSEITEQMFVPRFTALCSHNLVPIRKTCASNFGDFCAVVSRHVTETQLVSLVFFNLFLILIMHNVGSVSFNNT